MNSDKTIIDTCEKFLSNFGLDSRLKGICALTIAEDYQSLCGTFIFNYDTKTLLKQYPGYFESNSPKYLTHNGTKFTINLATNLRKTDSTKKHSGLPEDDSSYPFCCNECNPLSGKRLSNEHVFRNFKSSSGSSPYIYRVCKKISFGDLVHIKYFTLKDGRITEVERMETENKVNSFKTYCCKRHNTYYSVDLKTLEKTSNFHHTKGQNETEFGPKLLKLMSE